LTQGKILTIITITEYRLEKEGGMKKVVAVCWDAGPANNVGPVVELLRNNHVVVNLFAGGPALSVLDGMKIQYNLYRDAPGIVSTWDERSTVLYGAIDCNDKLPGVEIANELKRRGVKWPILLQNDMWGGGLYRNEEWRGIMPTRFFANDYRDAELGQIAFPLMDPKNALAIGWPWIDKYSDRTEVPKRSQSLRERLSIPEGMPIVLFAGQLNRTGEVWESLIRAIIALDKPVYLIGRMHPAMLPERDKDGRWSAEYKRYQEAIENFNRWGKGTYSLCNNPYEVKDLLAVSDVVTGAFTTMLLEASLWRKQVIAILYPNVGLQEWRDVTNGVMSEFPLTELDCAAKASSDQDLMSLLNDAYSGKLASALTPNQEKHFRSDGKNAERIANEIIKFL
jgi:hypothetical protein